MTNLAAFSSGFAHAFLSVRARRRPTSLLLLLVFAASAGLAQNAKTPETVDARAQASGTGTISGRVVGEDGRSLQDVLIYLYGAYARVPGPPHTATTDGEGKFSFPDLAPGLYTV